MVCPWHHRACEGGSEAKDLRGLREPPMPGIVSSYAPSTKHGQTSTLLREATHPEQLGLGQSLDCNSAGSTSARCHCRLSRMQLAAGRKGVTGKPTEEYMLLKRVGSPEVAIMCFLATGPIKYMIFVTQASPKRCIYRAGRKVLSSALSRLREVPEEGRHMTAQEELVL